MIQTIHAFGKRFVYNAYIDLRYGELLAFNRSRDHVWQRSKDRQGLICLWNSDYKALSHIFAGRMRPTDVLVDVGCGKGRVINWWLDHGHCNQPIIGLEHDPLVAAQTRQRLANYTNVTIVTGDAVANLPAHGTVFYLFNPFEEPVVAAFKTRMAQLFDSGSEVTILYYNCKHVALFANDPQWQVKIEKVGGAESAYQMLAVIKRAGATL
jgi:hypothetical protein